MTRALPAWLLLLGFCLCAEAPARMEITLERREGDVWRTVDPGLVLSRDDRVRFRFRSSFGGHLYVMNHGTTGAYTLLFPTADTGERNTIEPEKEYVVPATGGWFRITGPAGQDVVYWVVSPVELGGGMLPALPKTGAPRSEITPRCDDTIFRARGDCVDSSAGPQAVESEGRLPDNLKTVPGPRSRELIFIRKQHTAVVSSPAPLRRPVIYEFRLAHR